MIDLHHAATPNGLKIKTLLKEAGIPCHEGVEDVYAPDAAASLSGDAGRALFGQTTSAAGQERNAS